MWFEVLTPVTVKSRLFWVVVRREPEVREEDMGSIFRVVE
jgi:hypothetical protein